MVLFSERINETFMQCKIDLNFTSKSDEDFLVFVLSTVTNLVDTLKPVFYENENSKFKCWSTGANYPKKRLNVERFPSEQVNKVTDTSSLTDYDKKDTIAVKNWGTSVNPESQLKTPDLHLSANKSVTSPTPNYLSGSGSSRKFFSEIDTEDLYETGVQFDGGDSPSPKYGVEGSNSNTVYYEQKSGLHPLSTDVDTEPNDSLTPKYDVEGSNSNTVYYEQKSGLYPLSTDVDTEPNDNKPNENSVYFEQIPELSASPNSVVTQPNDIQVEDTQASKNYVCFEQTSEVVAGPEEGQSSENFTCFENLLNLSEIKEGHSESSFSRRITDCRDKRCMFCPSYDPKYISTTQIDLVDDDTLAMYKSASDFADEASSSDEFVSKPSEVEETENILEDVNECIENETISLWEEWSMVTAGDDVTVVSTLASPSLPVPQRVLHLSDKDLRAELISKGALVGPIIPSTRPVYEQYLVKIEDTPMNSSPDASLVGYPRELISCLKGQPQADWSSAEQSMMEEFRNPVVGKKYRQGTAKCFFNYLLLDPSIADDLPKQSVTKHPQEIFKLFVKSIFYVGKGKQSRPYSHLLEAAQLSKDNDKLRKIRDIWSCGRGVVSLHVYNNTIAEESFTREAVMISCIGLKKLTNCKRGEFYGVSRSWRPAKQRGVGLSLLYKAHLTLLNEGHREIRSTDIVP